MQVIDNIERGKYALIELLGERSFGVWKVTKSVVITRMYANKVKS